MHERNSVVPALTETWMIENEDRETYNLKNDQPIEANPRKKSQKQKGGVAFYIKTGID